MKRLLEAVPHASARVKRLRAELREAQPLVAHITGLASTVERARNRLLWATATADEAISRKEGVEAARSKAITKIRDRKDTIDKMTTGKFTFKGLFKNASEKTNSVQNMMTQI